LLPDGSLDRLLVVESSGNDAFDLEAVKAAKSAAPYPEFPRALSERELWLEVPVVFRP
jgi:TonB family protein